jgi:hypothetical protein
MPRWTFVLVVLGLACSSDDAAPGPGADTGGQGSTSHESHGHAHTSGETGETGESGATTQVGSSGDTTDADESTGTPVVDTWEGWALPSFFEVYCNSCHPGSSPRDFSDYDVVVANEEHIRCGVAPEAIESCDHHIEPGHLPIGDGPYPSDDERWRLVEWMQAGMPRQ